MTKVDRVEKDFYPTPIKLTHLLLTKYLKIPANQRLFLDPTAGNGHIVTVLANLFPESVIDANDVDGRWNWKSQQDATTPEYWASLTTHLWVITNPPFNILDEFLPLAWEHTSEGLALLLRLSAMEPTEGRGDTLAAMADHQTQRISFGQPRPRFRSDTKNTDSVTTAWYVWRKSWSWSRLGITPPFSYAYGWQGD